jgi:hypothetical protein
MKFACIMQLPIPMLEGFIEEREEDIMRDDDEMRDAMNERIRFTRRPPFRPIAGTINRNTILLQNSPNERLASRNNIVIALPARWSIVEIETCATLVVRSPKQSESRIDFPSDEELHDFLPITLFDESFLLPYGWSVHVP